MKLITIILLIFSQAWGFRVEGEGPSKKAALKNTLFNLSIKDSFQIKGLGGVKDGINGKDTVLVDSETWVTKISKVSCSGREWIKCVISGEKKLRTSISKPILPLAHDIRCSKLEQLTKKMVECWRVENGRKFEQAGYWFWKGDLVFVNFFRSEGQYFERGIKTFQLSGVGRNLKELDLIIEETVVRKRQQWNEKPERLKWLNQNAHEFLLFEATSN